jgi:hypothetical protein
MDQAADLIMGLEANHRWFYLLARINPAGGLARNSLRIGCDKWICSRPVRPD